MSSAHMPGLTPGAEPPYLAAGGENDNVTFTVIGLIYENNMNYLEVKASNRSQEFRIVALDLQNRPGLWYGGYGSQFCIVLPENHTKKLKIPVSPEYFKLTEDGSTFISVYEAESASLSSWPDLERRNKNYYGHYLPGAWRYTFTKSQSPMIPLIILSNAGNLL